MLTTSVLSKGKEKCLYVGGYTAVVKSLYLFGTSVDFYVSLLKAYSVCWHCFFLKVIVAVVVFLKAMYFKGYLHMTIS